ncbi:hypothetical protein NPIL_50331 [Nephila pilipes]|uniref:Uncharacterized protein n=1 Tax=Nephila pilipes TaxID=299642 RepID=A0A8X6MSS0_NEPPI|nr:hypothetical protein NPIL_50331 [Nephila pilipes]
MLYQRSKIQRHVISALEIFSLIMDWFAHLHTVVVAPLPPLCRNRMTNDSTNDSNEWLSKFRDYMQQLHPVPAACHAVQHTFMSSQVPDANYVYDRQDTVL